MVSQTAEYAIRAMLCLSITPQKALTTGDIARLTRSPAGYMAKVMQVLRRAGLVRSTRGTKGGFLLACDGPALNLHDIIVAVDPCRGVSDSGADDGAHGQAIGEMEARLRMIMASTQRELQACTLASLLDAKRTRKESPHPPAVSRIARLSSCSR